MRGQVLKADGFDGPGLILGDDGARYKYTQVQVRGGGPLAPGQQVDFISLGEEARDIYALGPAPAPAQSPGQSAAASGIPVTPPPVNTIRQPMPGPAAPSYGKPVATRGDGVWTYFLRGISRNYFRFTGRARRQEYWGYTLFNILTFIVALIVDGVISAAFFGTDMDGEMNYIPILTLLWLLYQIIPSIAVTVRRLHDQDLSGWLYLISFVPYIGGLVLFVFMLIDSRPDPNSHGPSPKYDQGLEAAYAFS